jgi:hypothetical protein
MLAHTGSSPAASCHIKSGQGQITSHDAVRSTRTPIKRQLPAAAAVGGASPVPAAAAAAMASMPSSAATAATKQQLLTESNMQPFIQQSKVLCKLLGGSHPLQVQQLLDGVINMVYRGVCSHCDSNGFSPKQFSHSATQLPKCNGEISHSFKHSTRCISIVLLT